MKKNINGIDVQIDGVDESDLPPQFDMDEVIQWVNEGVSVDTIESRINSKMWRQTPRSRNFWDLWCNHGT